MKNNSDRFHKKSGRVLPALCQTLGILLLVGVILTAIPLSLPRLLGYEIYNVISPSMEPVMPEGTLIYTKQLPPEEVKENDIIAFLSQGSVVTHRVVRNRFVEGDFITKGDANEANDPEPVSYGALIGRKEFQIPILGNLLSAYSSLMGKIYIALLALSGYLLTILAGRLRQRAEREEALQEKRRQRKASADGLSEASRAEQKTTE